MADKKRLAVVGYGGMGSWHVKRALDSDVVECAGIWDIAEKRRALALENGIRASLISMIISMSLRFSSIILFAAVICPGYQLICIKFSHYIIIYIIITY